MNKITTLLLGSAAAMVVATTGAEAADPIFDIKDPREPVYRCDITGFYEMPGTDVCFKVGGFAMAGVTLWDKKWVSQFTVAGIVPHGINAADDFDTGEEELVPVCDNEELCFKNEPIMHPTVLFGNGGNTTQFWTTGRLNFDARTETEYGTVRAFVEMQAYDNKTRSGGDFFLRHAIVQFGNWTFGKTWSTFLHLASSAPSGDPYIIVGDNFIRRNMIRYTQGVGDGVSVSIALEDQGFNNPQPVNAFPMFMDPINPTPFNTGMSSRRELPDLVANVNVSGTWGNAQLSGALHKNEVRSVTGFPDPTAASDSELGWALLFGMNLNVPTTEGSNLGFKAVYTDGASQYMGDLYAGSVNTIWCDPSGAFTTPDQICDTVTNWSVLGWYQHFWNATFSTSIGAGYAETEFGDYAPLVGWNDPFVWGGALPVNTAKQLHVFAVANWSPVARTSFQAEVHWGRIDLDGYGGYLPGLQMGNAGNPLFFVKSKEDAFSANFQVIRSF